MKAQRRWWLAACALLIGASFAACSDAGTGGPATGTGGAGACGPIPFPSDCPCVSSPLVQCINGIWMCAPCADTGPSPTPGYPDAGYDASGGFGPGAPDAGFDGGGGFGLGLPEAGL